ncbi:MAG: hypothetical protein K2R98_33690 [Gemmataceae bacterium]|nr:hypothetical protein [Gemmataceae bacterium]
MKQHWTCAVLIGVSAFAISCRRAPPPSLLVPSAPEAPAPLSVAEGEAPKDFSGLHNVVRVSEKLLSGSSPEEGGFASLQQLGVRTIITVDGARPDVAAAREHGLRYVHLPIGYDGVPREQALRIARAVRDLPGQVYMHCHHGKHRSPAAAAVVARCLDGRCTSDMALALLQRAGTAPHYKGLYAAVGQFEAILPEELDRVSSDFPEVAPTGMFVQHMVDIDTRWDHIKWIRAAGWKTPSKHPDLDPAHEALLLREGYRESARLPDVRTRSEELVRWLVESEKNTQELEDLLRRSKGKGTVDGPALEQAYKRAANDCTRCHAKYRDVPRK